MIVYLLLLLGALGAACQRQEAPTPTAPSTPAAPSPAPVYPPVNLIAPLSDTAFEGVSVTLEWNWIRKLRPDERFDVRVWPEGQPELGITWTQQAWLNLSNWLPYQKPGTYNWRIVVVQVQGDQLVRELTPPSERRRFTVASVDDPAKGVELPEGFAARVVAAVANPTSLALAADGALYIATLGGDIVAQTASQWGTEATTLFASGFESPTGLAIYQDALYVSSIGRVTALRDTNGDGASDEARELFAAGVLPGRQYDSHSNNGLVVGPDGHLYLTVGGTTDHGPESHPLGGVILRYDLATGQYQPFAHGFRNPYDLAFDAVGNLYAGDNGPDAPDANLLYIPPDEINLVRAGGHYGYPDVFGQPPAASDSEGPIILLPASSVTTGLTIYDGDHFPAEYQDAIFVALWGNAAITHPTGHRISVIPRSATGDYDQEDVRDFARGLQRPIDVIQTERGTLLVADFESGRIYEIEYAGE